MENDFQKCVYLCLLIPVFCGRGITCCGNVLSTALVSFFTSDIRPHFLQSSPLDILYSAGFYLQTQEAIMPAIAIVTAGWETESHS